MRIDQLYYLIDIAKTQSISTTAQRVFSSQQAVSEAIRKMEKELGTVLLNRSKTGVSLTADGQAVMSYSLEILAKYQEMLDYLERTAPQKQPTVTGNLIICAAPVIANTLLPEVIFNYSKQFPQVNISIREAESFEVMRSVIEDYYDLGLISVYESKDGMGKFIAQKEKEHLETQILFSDYLVVCVSRNSNLALQESITTDELSQNYKQTMYSSGHYQAMYENDSNILFMSNNTDLHKKFISQELAVCQMPHYAYEALFKGKEFVAVPISNAHQVNTYLIRSKAMPKTLPVDHFIVNLQTFIDEFSH